MHSAEAYARAHNLLARVGLADQVDAYPGHMSGGEQRRVVIARALINSPRLLLADEPTSDLDEDTEDDIIDLIEHLQQSDSFGLVLVTHNLAIARHATRTYEMRQGILAATDLPRVSIEVESRPRRFGPGKILAELEPELPAAARAPIGLGANLWRSVQTLVIGGAVVFVCILLVDFGLAKFQEARVRARGARIAKLAEIALSSLQGEVQSVSDLGAGRYELAVDLSNATGDEPIYVMSPDMRGYVQVGKVWQELQLKPTDDDSSGVLKIEGKHVYRYVFEARLRGFTQLLPNYMHVRFSDTMLVSPSSPPKDDVFERKDNYYVYLKPFDVADDVILRRMKFPGRPPVWIPMPPH
jgi:putative ABC transport system ATP-binding protein/macrolide transport system ATP-binding/permease protein/lipoprotein-releasing system ATP-binding protein